MEFCASAETRASSAGSEADAATPAPKLRVPPGNLEDNWMPHRLFAIKPEAIDALAGFLQATGWKLIYGLNFGNSTPERAATEAAYVARAVGERLEFFQIGNEPDFYQKANNGTRPPGWGFADYLRSGRLMPRRLRRGCRERGLAGRMWAHRRIG